MLRVVVVKEIYFLSLKNIFTSFTGIIDPYHIPIEEHNLYFSIVTEIFIHKRYYTVTIIINQSTI